MAKKKVTVEEAQESAATVALAVATYYQTLLAQQVPSEVAEDLTQQYQMALMGGFRGLIGGKE